MIPRRLIRTVPTDTTDEVEEFWRIAAHINPGYEMVTYRDPIDPAQFPLSSPHWGECSSGAQLAGLVRLEALSRTGGVYLDSDVECYRPFVPLLRCQAFGAWEDPNTVPDAVLGAEPNHPAIIECLHLAIRMLGQGAWQSGPGVTTTILPNRPDVLLLPPGAVYPYHYSERHRRHEDHKSANPYAFCCHHWAASWLR